MGSHLSRQQPMGGRPRHRPGLRPHISQRSWPGPALLWAGQSIFAAIWAATQLAIWTEQPFFTVLRAAREHAVWAEQSIFAAVWAVSKFTRLWTKQPVPVAV